MGQEKIYEGLLSSEIKLLQEKYGKNKLFQEKKESFMKKVIFLFSEE